METLEIHPEGVVLVVRAHAGARRNEIRGLRDGQLQVSVSAAPEQGKANRAIVDVLCDALSLRKSQVALLSGATARQKRFLIRDVSPAHLNERLAAALADRAKND